MSDFRSRTALQLKHTRKPEPPKSVGADDGYTLIELLVVLGILALLAGVVAPQVLRYLGSARTEAAKTQVMSLVSATELYYLDLGAYPPADVGLKALVEAPAQAKRWNGPYLRKSSSGLVDPWGRTYAYEAPGKHGNFDIFSLGRDGQVGGSGEDADVTSW